MELAETAKWRRTNIGTVKADLGAKERSYEVKYALNDAKGVRLLLGDWHALRERRYCGDTDACVILADLQTAIDRAGLTDRQRQALRLVYVEDLTQAEAGLRMGVGQPNVKAYIDHATEKIADIYENWSVRGEGYTFEEVEAVAV